MPQPFQFSSGAPGGGAMTAGYNNAMQNLNKSLAASQQTTSAQQMQLGQQLQQNQGQVQQSLANRGLGNTTVANTMQQAPMQTYNQGMAQVQNQGAMRSMQGYDALANAAMQGGSQISQYAAPYAQSQYIQQQQQQQQQNAPQGFSASGGMQTTMPSGPSVPSYMRGVYALSNAANGMAG